MKERISIMIRCKTGMAAYQTILKIIITIKPVTPLHTIIHSDAIVTVHSTDSLTFTCSPTGWGAALPARRKGFNHNKSRLWPSSQEQSAVLLHSLSRLPSSCWLPEDFFPLISPVNRCLDSLQIRLRYVIHAAPLDLSAAVPLWVTRV